MIGVRRKNGLSEDEQERSVDGIIPESYFC